MADMEISVRLGGKTGLDLALLVLTEGYFIVNNIVNKVACHN